LDELAILGGVMFRVWSFEFRAQCLYWDREK